MDRAFRVLSLAYVSFGRYVRLLPLPSSGCRGRSLRKPCGSPPSPVLRVHKTARPFVPVASGFPWRPVPPHGEEEMESSPVFLEIPLEACPELGTPATPAQPRIIGRPDAAFRFVNIVGIATSRVFGAESSRPASLLCALRTHQSPGEWQHSLPACLIDCDRAGLTPAGFHQEVSPSHLRFLLFQTFPSAITTSVVSRDLGSVFLQVGTHPFSGFMFVHRCFSSLALSRFSRNCRWPTVFSAIPMAVFGSEHRRADERCQFYLHGSEQSRRFRSLRNMDELQAIRYPPDRRLG